MIDGNRHLTAETLPVIFKSASESMKCQTVADINRILFLFGGDLSAMSTQKSAKTNDNVFMSHLECSKRRKEKNKNGLP